MNVDVIVDLEPVGAKVVWWATAPAVGNVAVVADSLKELEVLARDAIDSILEERGDAAGEVRFVLRGDAQASAGAEHPVVEFRPSGNVDDALPAEPTTAATIVDGQRAARELVPA